MSSFPAWKAREESKAGRVSQRWRSEDEGSVYLRRLHKLHISAPAKSFHLTKHCQTLPGSRQIGNNCRWRLSQGAVATGHSMVPHMASVTQHPDYVSCVSSDTL